MTWPGLFFVCLFLSFSFVVSIAMKIASFSIDAEEDHPSCLSPLFFVLWVMSNVSSGKKK